MKLNIGKEKQHVKFLQKKQNSRISITYDRKIIPIEEVPDKVFFR